MGFEFGDCETPLMCYGRRLFDPGKNSENKRLNFMINPLRCTYIRSYGKRRNIYSDLSKNARVGLFFSRNDDIPNTCLLRFRLCNDPALAEQLVAQNGLSRLVRLCKDESARLASDGVLVACLAAVRKVAAVCGRKHFDALDAAELVEPRLLDSFLIFSSKNESFV